MGRRGNPVLYCHTVLLGGNGAIRHPRFCHPRIQISGRGLKGPRRRAVGGIGRTAAALGWQGSALAFHSSARRCAPPLLLHRGQAAAGGCCVTRPLAAALPARPSTCRCPAAGRTAGERTQLDAAAPSLHPYAPTTSSPHIHPRRGQQHTQRADRQEGMKWPPLVPQAHPVARPRRPHASMARRTTTAALPPFPPAHHERLDDGGQRDVRRVALLDLRNCVQVLQRDGRHRLVARPLAAGRRKGGGGSGAAVAGEGLAGGMDCTTFLTSSGSPPFVVWAGGCRQWRRLLLPGPLPRERIGGTGGRSSPRP